MDQDVSGEGWAFSLARLDWDVFGSLTFRGCVPRPRVAYGLFWRYMRESAQYLHRPYRELLVALRCERGELGGRPHFHFLLGGTGSSNFVTLGFRLSWAWKGLTGSKQVNIRPYDRSRSGVAYCCKCLGANAYEVGKFDWADEVTCSAGVFRVMRKAAIRGQTSEFIPAMGCNTAERTCVQNGPVLSRPLPLSGLVQPSLHSTIRTGDEVAGS